MKNITLLLLLSASALLQAQMFTRGIGVYPGNPNEDFAPLMVPDSTTYRNLALRRAAYHSSSYDYNLTATLATDGIKDTTVPRTIAVSTSQAGLLSRIDRELIVDDNLTSTIALTGPKVWVQFELRGGASPLEIDRIEVVPRAGSGGFGGRGAQPGAQQPAVGWSCIVTGSDDGQSWRELGRTEAAGRPMAAGFRPVVRFTAPSRNRFLRVELNGPEDTRWNLSEILFYRQNERVKIGGPYHFTSAWMSAGAGQEWVYVDLGAECTFDRVVLFWIWRAAEGAIQVSNDAKSWTTLQALPSSSSLTDDLRLAQPAKGRYVRVLMTKPASPQGYLLSEIEVYGRGGPVARPKPQPAPDASGRIRLAGGAWRLHRDSLVNATGETISQVGFQDQDWVVATVPGTTLSSYFNIGAVPDANFGDNQLQISDSFFYADFWYRNEFTVPASARGKHVWLNFDGINWKAEVFVNGAAVGRIEGAFMRGKFDITRHVKPGVRNALAVRILKNATPGSIKEKTAESTGLNGGALGADNPTYHATVGWDWIPPVRGRDTGIWADVYLTTTGPVAIEDPFVNTTLPLPDTSRADITIEATLRNLEPKPVSGTLRGSFGPVRFEMPLTLDASSQRTVRLDPSTHPALRLQKPRLWWPNGYGEPYLYPVTLEFAIGAALSDRKSFQAGVRQFTYSEEGGSLRIWINGRRFIARGGNWGHPEANLRYRAREYDAAVRYHKDMNFTMIRNWVGQTGDEAFYEACDKYGIAIWQDFWLANPVDGPDPDDPEMFLRNVRDYVLRIRNHPSVALYVGRNEGSPPPRIDKGIRALLPELHPGIHYISDSAAGVVSGHGPYWANPTAFYFQQRATPKLHSEMGMPNVMTLESIRLTIPEDQLWPPSTHVWGLHDFTTAGAQRGGVFREIIDKRYGGASNIAEWATLAQFVNYDGYRAMFEAQSKNRMGLLIWMSHPAWPSFVWQTYDYFLEPTAGYFGAKKASEPIHIQWNPVTNMVEVVNYHAGDQAGLTARIEILNMDGARKWEKSATLSSKEDSVESPIQIEYPADLTPVHFLRLTLSQGARVLSTNFYLRGTQEYEVGSAAGRGPAPPLRDFDLRDIRNLPKVKLDASTKTVQQGNRWVLTTEIHNPSAYPALMVRLKAVREKSGDRILPVLYEDNYIALMPGERRTIRTELDGADTRGERPRIVVEGFNVAQ
jgi:hypothetical protein